MIDLVLVGIGGFGHTYVKELLECNRWDEIKIVGIVDPKPENCIYYVRLMEMNIPWYSTLEEFYSYTRADLAVIASPIQFHKSLTCLALAKGSHVLCEKPISATVEDAISMIEARDNAKKLLAIGYQWSYSEAIQSLKYDIMSGLFGKAKRLKTIVLWPRDFKYYNRSSWAGKKYDDNGNAIFDSVANNAAAHFLHNMFYVLGEKVDVSDQPAIVTSELYRANLIENFDTAIIRIVTKKGAELSFYASHAVENDYGPAFSYEFERGIVSYGEVNGMKTSHIVARFQDGTIKDYGDPFADPVRKLWSMIDAIQTGENLVCGPEAVFSHTLCLQAVQEAWKEINDFPQELLRIREMDSDNKLIFIEGLDRDLIECYNKNRMPGNAEYCWAKSGVEAAI
jgi:predicted dehydrogenase